MKASEIRHYLLVKAIELKQPEPNYLLIRALEIRIEAYQKKTGYKIYLDQMLGKWGSRPLSEFELYNSQNKKITLEGVTLLSTLSGQWSSTSRVIEIQTGKEKYI